MTKPKPRSKHIAVTIFGTLFYIVSAFGWLWAILPYIPDIAKLSRSLQPEAQPVEHVVTAGPPSLLLIIIAISVTIAILAMTVYVLIKLPSTIRRSGEKLTHSTSSHIVPILTHHTALSPKKRRQLTAKVTFYVKLLLCTLPVAVSACSILVPTGLSYELTMLVATFFAVIALVLLGTQLLLAKWLRVPLDIVW